MKIALVSPYDFDVPGGVTNHIRHLDAQFQALGHDVRIIAPSSSGENIYAYTGNVYRVGGVVPLRVSGSVARVSLSVRVYHHIKRILRDEKFDVVHLHEPLVPIVPLAVLRHSHTVNVGTFHAFRESHFAYSYGKPILKRFFNKLNGLIAVSPAAEELASHYFPGNYSVIPNGIDLNRFCPDSLTRIPDFDDGKINVLFVGRMEKRKGLKYLLRAWAQVRHQFPNCRLIVAGEGRLKTGLQQYVDEHQLPDVVFLGYVSENVLPRLYYSCDVFCAPSTGNESFGIVLLEAMAMGRPVVASNISGYASVMSHGEQGFLVAPEDPTSLAVALAHLMANEALRLRLGAQARERASEFSWTRVAQNVLSYYELSSRSCSVDSSSAVH